MTCYLGGCLQAQWHHVGFILVCCFKRNSIRGTFDYCIELAQHISTQQINWRIFLVKQWCIHSLFTYDHGNWLSHGYYLGLPRETYCSNL